MFKELTYYYGAMGCGKSRELLKTLHSKIEDGFSCAIVKPYIDKKGGNFVVSRDNEKVKVNFLVKPKDNIYLEISKYLVNKPLDFLLVDEAQFLSKEHIDQLTDIVDILNVTVICYGLKTDFKGELFEGAKRLLEVSDNIRELERQCSCGRKKIFNMRLRDDQAVFTGEQVEIDGIDAVYEPKCRYCYKKEFKKQNED